MSKSRKGRRILRYFAPYARQWAVVLGCILGGAGAGVLPPLCVGAIFDRAIPQRDVGLLSLLCAAVVLLTLAASLLGVLQTFLSTRIGQHITSHLRLELFERLQAMSVPFYSHTRSGEIVSRINNDVNAVQNTVTATFVNIVSNALTVLITLGVIFALSWRLALLTLVVIPLLLLPMRAVGRTRQRLSRQTQEKQAEMTAFLQERLHFGGMLLAKTFGRERADAGSFAAYSREVAELNTRSALAGQWVFLLFGVSASVIPTLIYFGGGLLAMQGQLSTGGIIALVNYLINLYRPLAGLASVYVELKGSMAVFARIFEFLDLQPEVEEKSHALVIQNARGHVRFQNVSFSYPAPPPQRAPDTERNGSSPDGLPPDGSSPDDEAGETKRPFALQDISFEMLPGERVALVGPSGAGKTTLTYLLPRFLDPQSGQILLDDHPLRDLSLESLRAQIGIVTQETFLFHASVRDNLLYARPDATERELLAAARAAHVHDFVQSLPYGYDTMVGERAFRLSGGERQRLAIARALLKDPRLLILDEATSHLDATSEHLIQEALELLLRGRTSLILAHRLSTVVGADKILVMEKGGLVESGAHAELLARGGLYASLYRMQFRRVLESYDAREATGAP